MKKDNRECRVPVRLLPGARARNRQKSVVMHEDGGSAPSIGCNHVDPQRGDRDNRELQADTRKAKEDPEVGKKRRFRRWSIVKRPMLVGLYLWFSK